MSVEQAAEIIAPHLPITGHLHHAKAYRVARQLHDAGLLATDDEIEFRSILAESERPDMQALADKAIRDVKATIAIVNAAVAVAGHWPTSHWPGDMRQLGYAVDDYLAAQQVAS